MTHCAQELLQIILWHERASCKSISHSDAGEVSVTPTAAHDVLSEEIVGNYARFAPLFMHHLGVTDHEKIITDMCRCCDDTIPKHFNLLPVFIDFLLRQTWQKNQDVMHVPSVV